MKLTTLQLLSGFVMILASCDRAHSADVGKEAKDGAVVLAQKHFMPPAGTIATKDATMTMTDAVIKMKAGEQEMAGTLTQTETSKETREILSADKFRSLLESKTTHEKMKLNDQDQAAPEKSDALVGVPVILERKDGKWSASLEKEGEPSAEQQAALDKEAASASRDSDFAMYGDTPRKPGDKWDVDPAKLMDFGDAEGLTGKYRVEFVEVKEVKGVRCAVLKATFDIKGKTKAEGDGPQMDIQLKGEAVSQRSIADKIDLNVEVNAKVTVSGSPTPEMSMHVEGPMRMTEKISLKKP